MPTAIEEVLNDLGWNDGFRLPIANSENKCLEKEIERKTRQRAALKTQLETIRERINDIRKHASDVRQEHRQNQKLLAAHSAQVETENNVYRQAQVDESKLNQEIRRCEKQARDSSDKISQLQANVDKLTKKLEKTKKKVMLDKDKLFAWEEKLNQKDEKNMVIEQFVKSDEKTFKKIELERQTLSERAEVYRQAVARAVGEYQELELSLDRTARLYSQAIKYRRQLMDQWSVSVHVLTQRDKAIYKCLQEINEQRELAKERLDSYQEAERFFAIQQSENKELEDGIKQLERDLILVKDERQKLRDIIDSYNIELQVKKKHLQEVIRRTNDTRTNFKRKKEEIDNKRNKLAGTYKRIEDLKTTLVNLEGQNLSTEERAVQLQDMLEKEEKRKSAIAKETRRQQALLFRASQHHKALEDERKVVAVHLLGETRRTEQLAEERATVLRTLRESKELAYQTDLDLQRTETRLQRLLGQEKDRSETEAKQARLKQVQALLRDKADMFKIIQAQVNQVNNDARKRSDAIASNNEEIQRLRAKQQHLLVMIEGGEKHLRSALANYEERKVEENILQLKLKETEKIISKVDDKLYNLEKYALQMEAAMQERRAEIKAQKEKLSLQKRVIGQECGELRSVIAERRAKIQQLQVRIELQTASLGTNPEDGTPMTSTYLIVQSAQERYLLHERGDELDMAIRKAEAEIRSMENTLRLVNACNSKYKSSLSLVDDGGPEKAEQRKLDDELYNILGQHRQRKQVLEVEKDDCEKMKENCEQLESEIKRTQEEKETKRQTVENLEQQITEQREKLLRADKNLKQILRDIKKKCACISNDTILLQERDIAVRDLRELNTLALQRVAEFMIRHLEAEVYVKKLLIERKIDLPFYLKQQSAPTPVSSRADSVASTSRTSIGHAMSSRESLGGGSVVLLTPDFGRVPKARLSKSSQDVSSRRSSFKKWHK